MLKIRIYFAQNELTSQWRREIVEGNFVIDFRTLPFSDRRRAGVTRPWWQIQREYHWGNIERIHKMKADFDARPMAQFFELLLDHPKGWNESPFETRGHVEEYIHMVSNEANRLDIKGYIYETPMSTMAIYMEGVRKTILSQFTPFFKKGSSHLEVRKYRMTMWTAITHYSMHNFEILDMNATLHKQFLNHIARDYTWVTLIPDSSEESDTDDIEKYRNETWIKKHNYFVDYNY